MRSDKELKRNEYVSYHRRRRYYPLKRRAFHNDEHYSHRNESHTSVKPSHHHYHDEIYPSPSILSSSLYRNHNVQSSHHHHCLPSRLDRRTKNHDIYSSLLTEQSIITDDLHPTVSYYVPLQSISDRNSSLHGIDSERNRYSPSLTYRRDNFHSTSLSEYRNSNDRDVYIRREYRSPSLSKRCIMNTYDDVYQLNDYNHNIQQHDSVPNRNDSSRDHHSMPSVPTSLYRSDSYRILPTIQMSSSSMTRDQYTQTLPSRNIDCGTNDYEMTIPMDHRSRSFSKTYDYYDSSSRNRLYLKRSKSDLNENKLKRPMKR